MVQTIFSSDAELPSFSIVLETENLASASLDGLSNALASLIHQDVPLGCANEVVLIDSGDAPPELLRQLCDRYPWIKVYPAPPTTGYYKAKMLGAQIATSEIIVYADSDCFYEPHWLRTILTTFTQDSDIQVVAGETTTRGFGPYGTAMALTYIFPQYSGKSELTRTAQYFLNNVAFRREFLLSYPIPTELPLYRGNCVVHVHTLHQQGHVIWQQPNARATHAPPNGLFHFFWRFLLIGHDYYWQKRLIQEGDRKWPVDINVGRSKLASVSQHNLTVSGFNEKFRIFRDRMSRLFINNPLHVVYFPFAVPIILMSVLLIYLGYSITRLKPGYLLRLYDQLEEESRDVFNIVNDKT